MTTNLAPAPATAMPACAHPACVARATVWVRIPGTINMRPACDAHGANPVARIPAHRIMVDDVEVATVTGYGDTWHAMTATQGMLPGYFLTFDEAVTAARATATEGK